jgi:serine phosphatase RsbU (regulator of sigma subunit)
MSTLHVLNGEKKGTIIPLDGDQFLLGRDPSCAIVIPVTSVSRTHAKILRDKDRFYLEDLESRNGTYLNNQLISGRTPLKNNDKIRICDFLAAFQDGTQPPLPAELAKNPIPEEDEPEAPSSIEGMLSQSNYQLLEAQPADKLRALLEISTALGKTLEVDRLLPQIGESLFGLFRQADRCFVIESEEDGPALKPRVIKTRRPQEETTARFSKSIVRQCLESGQAFLTEDAGHDPRIQMSQSVVDFRIRSVMCVPLRSGEGRPFGVIQLDTQNHSKKFTQDDLKFLWGVANTAAVAIENARLHEASVRRERQMRDIELAKQVQLSFLPRERPHVTGYDFGSYYKSAQLVGGDYYGFIPLPGGRLAMTVGDVAGKGVPAALLMAKLSSDTRFSLLTEEDPGRAITKLNDLLYEQTSQVDRFVTLAAAVLDPARHEVTLVNAGHLAPLLYRVGTGWQEAVDKNASGLPLGIMEGSRYETCTVNLRPGETLILYTDGVTDALNVRREAFGQEGVDRTLKATGSPTPAAVVERLAKAIEQHSKGSDPHDDVTLVSLGRVG